MKALDSAQALLVKIVRAHAVAHYFAGDTADHFVESTVGDTADHMAEDTADHTVEHTADHTVGHIVGDIGNQTGIIDSSRSAAVVVAVAVAVVAVVVVVEEGIYVGNYHDLVTRCHF